MKMSANIMSVGINNSSVQIKQENGIGAELMILSLDPIITFVNAGDFSEVDQWIPAHQAGSLSKHLDLDNQIDADPITEAKFGSAIGDAIRYLGLHSEVK